MLSGGLPTRRVPTVLLATQLTEVRGFSDFFSEFFQVSTDMCHPGKLSCQCRAAAEKALGPFHAKSLQQAAAQGSS